MTIICIFHSFLCFCVKTGDNVQLNIRFDLQLDTLTAAANKLMTGLIGSPSNKAASFHARPMCHYNDYNAKSCWTLCRTMLFLVKLDVIRACSHQTSMLPEKS